MFFDGIVLPFFFKFIYLYIGKEVQKLVLNFFLRNKNVFYVISF